MTIVQKCVKFNCMEPLNMRWRSCALMCYWLSDIRLSGNVTWQCVYFAMVKYSNSNFSATYSAFRIWTHRASSVKIPCKSMVTLENPFWSVTMHSNGILTLDARCVHPFKLLCFCLEPRNRKVKTAMYQQGRTDFVEKISHFASSCSCSCVNLVAEIE